MSNVASSKSSGSVVRPVGDDAVSVVLPVRDGMATLPRALASLRAQTFRNWELIVINDGSTDGTGAWLDQALAGNPRARVFHLPPLGIVAALNLGLKAARGRWIARMDADDVCHPDRLEAQAAFLSAHEGLDLAGCLVEFAGDARSEGYARHVEWLNSVVTGEEVERARFIESPFAHPSVMFRRELAEAHGGYAEGPFPEDYELWLRWLERGARMAKVPRALLQWHDSPGRLSRTDARYSPDAFYRLKAGFLARWLKGRVGNRPLWIWGAGRVTRRRASELAACGVTWAAHIDIDPRKQGIRRGRRVAAPEEIPPPGEVFVVGYVGSRGARELQRAFLEERGHVEGRDFIFAA